MHYIVTAGNADRIETLSTKAAALRRAATITKFYKGVVKVHDSHGNFIKSFDGRKNGGENT